MSTTQPTENHDRGSFEGRVEQDLKWICESIKTIQVLCMNRGERIQRCEMDLQALRGHDDRIRAVEKEITQVKAVGGVLGTLGGILASVGIKLWGGHS